MNFCKEFIFVNHIHSSENISIFRSEIDIRSIYISAEASGLQLFYSN